MKFNIVILCLIICLVASLSIVSANDASTADVNSTDFNGEKISVCSNESLEDNQILSAGEDEILTDDESSFSQLSDDIQSGGSVELSKNYKYVSTDDSSGIVISNNLVLDGKDYTIDANGSSAIFTVSEGINVTLKNINFINAYYPDNGAVIKNNGRLTIDNCTFNDNSNHMGETIYSGG